MYQYVICDRTWHLHTASTALFEGMLCMWCRRDVICYMCECMHCASTVRVHICVCASVIYTIVESCKSRVETGRIRAVFYALCCLLVLLLLCLLSVFLSPMAYSVFSRHSNCMNACHLSVPTFWRPVTVCLIALVLLGFYLFLIAVYNFRLIEAYKKCIKQTI